MQQISGNRVGVKFAPVRAADVKHCTAKTDNVKKELGHVASVGSSEGLKEYMEWFRENCVI